MRDVVLPRGVVSAIPIGGHEAGDLVCLGCDELGNESERLRLVDPVFGIPAGWIALGEGHDSRRTNDGVVSPRGGLAALSGRPEVGIPLGVARPLIACPWRASRTASHSGLEFAGQTVSDDGGVIGVLRISGHAGEATAA